MRFLKTYESLAEKYFTQEEVDDISDIFRDMVDEFDMIYYDDDDDYDSYLCYQFIGYSVNDRVPRASESKSVFISKVDESNLNRICVKILFPLESIESKSKISSEIDIDKVMQYKDQFINRLKQVGYDVVELLDFVGDVQEPRNQYGNLDTIKINISKKK